jgi:phenylpropionate dioxygenase-like ring-hydroxylating dioxygenase large terminal subunit
MRSDVSSGEGAMNVHAKSVRSPGGKSPKDARKMPYGGYFQRDVPPPDAEITSTDPGTPMGEFMRRFWQPVCLSEELGDLVKPIRIMGEDLVAFRDLGGRVGVLHRHCSHRGTSLEYGMLEERGVRCCYHGWQFDVDGTILETPGEPENSRIRENLCHGAYPAFERHGLVFAYMGPPDLKPDFPVFDSIEVPGNRVYPFSNRFACNWLQVQDNIVDPAHTTIFHNGIGNRALREGAAHGTGTALPKAWSAEMPVMEYRVTEDGRSMVYIVSRRVGDKVWVRNNHFILPNYIEIAGLFETLEAQKYFTGVGFVRWIVPHDDTSSTIFAWRYFNTEVDPEGRGDPSKLGVEGGDFLGGQTGGRPPEEQQRYPGDWEAIMGQRAIAVHAKENLGATDQGVAMWRKLCRDALHDKTPRAWPAAANGGEARFASFCQDTIFAIPELADADADRKLVRMIGRRVTDVVTDESLAPGDDRKRAVRERLRALEEEIRAGGA